MLSKNNYKEKLQKMKPKKIVFQLENLQLEPLQF
ncbi:hypothetical protein IMAU60212_00880 [Lactobacillus helveticus]|nr:hypothetical protein [Lactobacillus helveticus]NRO40738.1 hypothetical protein [Lactobacillus helveticus]NRO47158.1 hypothetical protein [Lactobacillus helveticus]NRO56423.1 hypothetical protein [Lactobacillus helveticus]NRO60211.1 hypothetical protein [Lactobacillus helveticus]